MASSRLISFSEMDPVRLDDSLKEDIAKGELTYEIIRGVLRTYLNPEGDETKFEISLAFGIKHSLPGTIIEAYYQVGGRTYEKQSAEEREEYIDLLIEWIS